MVKILNQQEIPNGGNKSFLGKITLSILFNLFDAGPNKISYVISFIRGIIQVLFSLYALNVHISTISETHSLREVGII